MNKAEITKLKTDAEETLAKVDMSAYNKDTFVLIGASLAIKNHKFAENEKKEKKNNFDEYYKKAMKTLKEALSLYDLAEKTAYTQDDVKKLEVFKEYLAIVLQKKQDL